MSVIKDYIKETLNKLFIDTSINANNPNACIYLIFEQKLLIDILINVKPLRPPSHHHVYICINGESLSASMRLMILTPETMLSAAMGRLHADKVMRYNDLKILHEPVKELFVAMLELFDKSADLVNKGGSPEDVDKYYLMVHKALELVYVSVADSIATEGITPISEHLKSVQKSLKSIQRKGLYVVK